ncbi:MAG TPA: cystathionine beta-lyase [Stellaceae bacterium]|jgi:cystathionine beta-lyase|nr:cystathionine beta-lyase [Stellaceae bacterium]
MRSKSNKPDTLLTHAGREPEKNFGVVNPPVYHASTILFPTVAEYEASGRNRYNQITYGRHGTPTTRALEEAMAAIEGGHRAVAFCSGVAACYASILAFVKTGDHILVVDSVYGPVRAFCSGFLKRFGVETTFYDPLIGANEITALFKPNTVLVYLESPGSLTFEVQDVPAIVAAAKARGLKTLLDNTWAAPLFLKPLALGVDVDIISATKYIVGHSDAMMGIAVCTEESFLPVRNAATDMGNHAAPDDCYLAMRGLRSAGVRLRQHQKQALALAQHLEARPEVERVMYPALPSDPGHALWKRDFTGASGLFGVALKQGTPKKAIDAMLDGFELYGMGASWGGFESLVLPTHPDHLRSAAPWKTGPCLRFHAGLEDIDDLIADLDAGFERLNAAR